MQQLTIEDGVATRCHDNKKRVKKWCRSTVVLVLLIVTTTIMYVYDSMVPTAVVYPCAVVIMIICLYSTLDYLDFNPDNLELSG